MSHNQDSKQRDDSRPTINDVAARLRAGAELRPADQQVVTRLARAFGAEDAAQEGLLKYMGEPPKAGVTDAARLTTAIRNCARDIRRKERRAKTRERKVAVPDLDGSANPLEALLDAEVNKELDAAVGRLKDDLQAVVNLHVRWELSIDETAAKLGVPKGTVKDRLRRARQQLRAELKRVGWGPSGEATAPAA